MSGCCIKRRAWVLRAMHDCMTDGQPAVQTTTGSLNDTSATSTLDAAKLSFAAYTSITQDALGAAIVSAQGSSSPGRRYVTLPWQKQAMIGGSTQSPAFPSLCRPPDQTFNT